MKRSLKIQPTLKFVTALTCKIICQKTSVQGDAVIIGAGVLLTYLLRIRWALQ